MLLVIYGVLLLLQYDEGLLDEELLLEKPIELMKFIESISLLLVMGPFL
jgi:hypothetical protein